MNESPAVVLFDACVLWGAALCDLLMCLHEDGRLIVACTPSILDEVVRTVSERRGIALERLVWRRSRMEETLGDWLLPDVAELPVDLELPDPDDRKQVAAACLHGVRYICTFNLKDHPSSILAPVGLTAVHPDLLLCEVLEQDPSGVLASLQKMSDHLKRPHLSPAEIAHKLRGYGTPDFSSRLLALLGAS